MNSRIDELLPHRWQPLSWTSGTVKVSWPDAYCFGGFSCQCRSR